MSCYFDIMQVTGSSNFSTIRTNVCVYAGKCVSQIRNQPFYFLTVVSLLLDTIAWASDL